jgi:hypothetical protein
LLFYRQEDARGAAAVLLLQVGVGHYDSSQTQIYSN